MQIARNRRFGKTRCGDLYFPQLCNNVYLRVMQNIKIVIEKHPEGYVAYPVGMKGVVIGEGDTYEEALADVKSAITFHIETFGNDVFINDESPVIELFVAEMAMAS